MEDLLQFTNEDIAGVILDENFDDVFSAEFTQGLTELRLDTQAPLCVPSDDLSEFDWLSSFDVKASPESLPQQGMNVPRLDRESFNYDKLRHVTIQDQADNKVSKCCVVNSCARFEASCAQSPTSVLDVSTDFKQSADPCTTAFPARPRSKRSRAISRSWSSNLLSELYYSKQSSSQASSENANSGNEALSDLNSSDFSPCHSLAESGDSSAYNTDLYSVAESGGKRLSVKFTGLKTNTKGPKKSRRKRLTDNPVIRRCTHCSTTKTPQWRAGPDGPKTLCNACGVRYKSGRLLPEYRPAGSPGYVFNKHSNSHRKILEMRRLQELKQMEIQTSEGSYETHSQNLTAYDSGAKPEASVLTKAA